MTYCHSNMSRLNKHHQCPHLSPTVGLLLSLPHFRWEHQGPEKLFDGLQLPTCLVGSKIRIWQPSVKDHVRLVLPKQACIPLHRWMPSRTCAIVCINHATQDSYVKGLVPSWVLLEGMESLRGKPSERSLDHGEMPSKETVGPIFLFLHFPMGLLIHVLLVLHAPWKAPKQPNQPAAGCTFQNCDHR